MTVEIHLLGKPCIRSAGAETYRFRSRKTWALLTYLLLTERPPSRGELAGLLFATADDPFRALRWGLAEVRRALGEAGTVDGDPVELHWGSPVDVDVTVAAHGPWTQGVRIPGLGRELLEGISLAGAPVFDTWLLAQRRRCAAAAEAVLHEAAVGELARNDLAAALGHAVGSVAMDPLNESHQALLIRLYRLAGDDDAAVAQYDACRALFRAELGVQPGIAVESALRELARGRPGTPDSASVGALVESGAAAISAGALATGVDSLRGAVRLADELGSPALRIDARLVLAEALVHSMRGMDEEGVGALHEADRLAVEQEDLASSARARAELGYVDFLCARYQRSERWLRDSLSAEHHDASVRAKAMAYLGTVESDQGDYRRASPRLTDACDMAEAAGDIRQLSYGMSMLGRIDLLRGDVDAGEQRLRRSIALAESDHWLAFVPWPQALLGECLLETDRSAAATLLNQAFARACQLGDPCWEGTAGRGLALVAEASGDPEAAFRVLADARARCNRLADGYAWLDVYILDAQCSLGRRHDHPDTSGWVETMRERASRTGMRELLVRSLLHGAALGHAGDAQTAALLASDLDNPVVSRLVNVG